MKKLIMILCVVFCLVLMTGCKTKEQKAGLGNPWVETKSDGLITELGLDMDLPEGAEDAVYRVNKTEGLGEIKFKLNGMDFTARIKATPAFEDISGLYYTWEQEEPCKISWCEGKILRAKDGENTVDACLWCDIVPGISYSLSTIAPDLDGFDITAIAEEIFRPMQGDAG